MGLIKSSTERQLKHINTALGVLQILFYRNDAIPGWKSKETEEMFHRLARIRNTLDATVGWIYRENRNEAEEQEEALQIALFEIGK